MRTLNQLNVSFKTEAKAASLRKPANGYALTWFEIDIC